MMQDYGPKERRIIWDYQNENVKAHVKSIPESWKEWKENNPDLFETEEDDEDDEGVI